MNKNLYIIGNGFDRYHKLQTSYQAFAFYLQENYVDIYDYLIQYYGLPDLDSDDPDSYYDPLWSEFESALADLDYESILDENTDLVANPASEDFKDRDWHAMSIEMEGIVESLTTKLLGAFKSFILNVEFPVLEKDLKLKLDNYSMYFTFNYTDTLETYYNILPGNITYIHKKAKNPEDDLILGHGTDPSKFSEKPDLPPQGLTDEEYEQWRDMKADEYDYSYDSAKQEIRSYFSRSFKPTGKVITSSSDFFLGLREINQVYVLGHSLASVDHAYFREILKNLSKDAKWIVSYHYDSEMESHLKNLELIGVERNNIQFIKISDLK